MRGLAAGVCGWYDPTELGDTPLGAQIMGSNPALMAEAARYLAERGAPRVDLK
jgi:tRNA-dihydrouridine synthase